MAAGLGSSEHHVTHEDKGKSDSAMPAVTPSDAQHKQPLSSDAGGRWRRTAGKVVSAMLFASMWFGESACGRIKASTAACMTSAYILLVFQFLLPSIVQATGQSWA